MSGGEEEPGAGWAAARNGKKAGLSGFPESPQQPSWERGSCTVLLRRRGSKCRRGLCLSRHGSSVTRGRQARPGSGRSLPTGRCAQLPTHCFFSADFTGLLFFPPPTNWLAVHPLHLPGFYALPLHTRPGAPARSPGGCTRSPRSSLGGPRITMCIYA